MQNKAKIWRKFYENFERGMCERFAFGWSLKKI